MRIGETLAVSPGGQGFKQEEVQSLPAPINHPQGDSRERDNHATAASGNEHPSADRLCDNAAGDAGGASNNPSQLIWFAPLC